MNSQFFPIYSSSCSSSTPCPRLLDASGHSATAVLRAVLALLPLDSYVDSPAAVMDRVDSDKQRGLKAFSNKTIVSFKI